jgi:hypothetical protein
LIFALLSIGVAAVVARSELNRFSPAATRCGQSKETTGMTKKKEGWQQGLGPYSEDDAGLTHGTDNGTTDRFNGKDLSKLVDENAADESAKLRSGQG